MQGPADEDDGWFDDPDDDDLDPLPPLGGERTWVHPSEVGMDQRGRSDRRRGKVLAGGLVVGGVGLLLAGVLMGLGWGNGDSPQATSSTVDAVTPSLAALTVVRGSAQSTVTGVVLDGEGHVAVRASALDGSSEVWASCGGRPPARAEVVASDDVADVAVVRVPTESGRAVVDGTRPRAGAEVTVVRMGSGEAEPTSWRSDVADSQVHLVQPDGSVTEAMFTTSVADPRPTTTLTGGSSSTILTTVSRTDVVPGDGAVFDGRGRFLGLVVRGDRTSQFVVPASTVTRISDELIAGGHVRRSWLGLTTTDATADTEHPGGTGAVVVAVAPGSPAATAGITPGDVVVGIGATEVHRMLDLAAAVQRLDVGSVTQLTVERDGGRRMVSVRTADPTTTPTSVAPGAAAPATTAPAG